MHALGFRLRRQATVAPGCWLVFERQTPPFIERLMGWTGGGDTLPQIELTFPTLDAAVAYAERQGLDYLVQAAADTDARRNRTDGEPADRQAFLDMLTARLALAWLHTRYGIGGPTPSLDREKAFRPGRSLRHPADVVADPEFSVQDKEAILRNWARHKYLADVATVGGMPDSGRPSRLYEVEAARSSSWRCVRRRRTSSSRGKRHRPGAAHREPPAPP